MLFIMSVTESRNVANRMYFYVKQMYLCNVLRDQHKVELIGLVCENILPSVVQWLIPIQINPLILLFLCLQINETMIQRFLSRGT